MFTNNNVRRSFMMLNSVAIKNVITIDAMNTAIGITSPGYLLSVCDNNVSR